jgi:sulfur-oxidizing protein SoxY
MTATGDAIASRRDALMTCATLLIGSGAWVGSAGATSAEDPFAATTVDDVLRAIGGLKAAGAAVDLDLPDAIENGALVPISVTSHLPATREILIVVEANPNPLVARFVIPDGTEPFIALRIKVAESCRVHAVVRAGGGHYAATQATQVTIGGCGG